jgi:uncharacterized protein
LSLQRRSFAPPRRQGALPALVVFARTPSPGKVKTRLIPMLGPRGAAEFHAALLSDTLRKVNDLARKVTPYFYLAGGKYPASSSLLDYRRRRQSGADLGARLDRAFRDILPRHGKAVVIGTDSPGLPGRILSKAMRELSRFDAVLGPCPDGGFYLIGLRRIADGIFDGVRWGSGAAFEDMRANLEAHGFACTVLDPIADIDRPEDVQRLEKELEDSRAARKLAPSTWQFLKGFFVLKGHGRKTGKDKAW